MGYFSNGAEHEQYEARYCCRCVHQGDEDYGPGCAVMQLHFERNYEECNDKGSLLHVLIPRDGIHNGECRMFHAKAAAGGHEAWLQKERLMDTKHDD